VPWDQRNACPHTYAVVPVILDEVEAARRLGEGAVEIDPAEKIRRLKMELRGEKVDRYEEVQKQPQGLKSCSHFDL